MIIQQTMQTLQQFLNNKPLFYDKIDYDVIKKAWDILSSSLKLPYVIHVVGTNGKGSTGRFISSFLYQNNQNVLHYSSPHILKFNERIWINGNDVSDEQLNKAYQKLQTILTSQLSDDLTYFEYTTLIALVLADGFDFIVLEAGLGGEFDATNVVENNLSVFTTIGLDHIEFLGDTIEQIATTKMKSCDNSYIMSNQVYKEVYEIKDRVLKDKHEIIIDEILSISQMETLPLYLQQNLQTALKVLKYLNFEIINLILPPLFGRCQKINNNITIDVGHNVLAANVLFEHFKTQKVILVYNSYKDKDYKQILTILKPIIKKLLIIGCEDVRIANPDDIRAVCSDLNIEVDTFNDVDNDEQYLVFGSFKVVENFLKFINKVE